MKSIIIIIIVLIGAFTFAPAQDYSRGISWPELAAKIDTLIEATRQHYKIIGMTVAVSQAGRLLHSKGYGYAKANILPQGGLEFAPMLQDMRTRIGSVTKAVITGPVAYQAMEEKGIDPRKQSLYGADGILGNQFAAYQAISNRRFFPIIAMAISTEDRVYTWYTHGQFTVGSSNKLDRYQGTKPYSLPADYSPIDIQAMAISKSNKVYVWYKNGTRSIGTPDDLDRHQKPDPAKRVKFPSGKSMLNVVGIAIAKSNDRVYVWYDDGTRSIGTSLDFAKYEAPKKYSTPSMTPGTMSVYDIRGLGISSKDRVYAWYSNDRATSGTSKDLDRYRSPYSYSLPELKIYNHPIFDWRAWWGQITLHYLLTHRSGFERSGDGPGSMQMFGVSEANLTYTHIHKHFLATRFLKWEPGLVIIKGMQQTQKKSYSNHGFGLWTMIIPEITNGQSYRDYARKRYFAPLGLYQRVRPMTASPDIMDSDGYNMDRNNKAILNAPRNAGLGLAAGGWTASAKSLLWITRYLSNKYSIEELKSMGWGARTGGKNNQYEKLHHNGLIAGGMAYVVLFPAGYVSKSGKNLSEIHVAIATNTSDFTKLSGEKLRALEQLASQIALAVPDANVPRSWNIWGGLPEIVRYGIDAARYPFTFEHGYRPVWLDAYWVNGKTYFNVIFHPEDGTPWVARHGLSASQYQAAINHWIQRGYRPLHVESYPDHNGIRYAVIFVKQKGPAWRTYHGISPADHQQRFYQLTSQGYHPLNISAVSLNGKVRITALYEKGASGSFVALLNIPVAEFQQQNHTHRAAGRTLTYLDAWQHNGTVYFSAIWKSGAPKNVMLRHELNPSQYADVIEQQQSAGARTLLIAGYEVKQSHRFTSIWLRKPGTRLKPMNKMGN
ncbi:MAG: beta-lactamase family protein [Calditrichaeota bacterium]|nr:beta-lactamase family protein [Calditrichota bacterium]